jgi:hypothetical protein
MTVCRIPNSFPSAPGFSSDTGMMRVWAVSPATTFRTGSGGARKATISPSIRTVGDGQLGDAPGAYIPRSWNFGPHGENRKRGSKGLTILLKGVIGKASLTKPILEKLTVGHILGLRLFGMRDA